MPTVLRQGPYRLFFYSGDRVEPPHVHVERGDNEAKVWLDPVRVQRNTGFRAAELRDIERLVSSHQGELLEAWNGFFAG
jgi:hypothetical protein